MIQGLPARAVRELSLASDGSYLRGAGLGAARLARRLLRSWAAAGGSRASILGILEIHCFSLTFLSLTRTLLGSYKDPIRKLGFHRTSYDLLGLRKP